MHGQYSNLKLILKKLEYDSHLWLRDDIKFCYCIEKNNDFITLSIELINNWGTCVECEHKYQVKIKGYIYHNNSSNIMLLKVGCWIHGGKSINNCGLGTFLLLLYEYIMFKMNIYFIKLDNLATKSNIYKNIGYKYLYRHDIVMIKYLTHFDAIKQWTKRWNNLKKHKKLNKYLTIPNFLYI